MKLQCQKVNRMDLPLYRGAGRNRHDNERHPQKKQLNVTPGAAGQFSSDWQTNTSVVSVGSADSRTKRSKTIPVTLRI